MELGDLVQYQDKRWLVTSYDRVARLMTLYSLDGSKIELPREFDRTHTAELGVVANPPKQWPMLTAPFKSGAGPFVRLVVPGPPGRDSERVLEPWVDWVPSDFAREGGSFFVRPEVRLLPGMLLLATHRSGSLIRIVVPKTFGTVAHRVAVSKARAPAARPSEQNRFTRLFNDDDD